MFGFHIWNYQLCRPLHRIPKQTDGGAHGGCLPFCSGVCFTYFGALGKCEEVCVLWAGSAPAHSYPVVATGFSASEATVSHPAQDALVSVLSPERDGAVLCILKKEDKLDMKRLRTFSLPKSTLLSGSALKTGTPWESKGRTLSLQLCSHCKC